jgi:hypothetical protein
LGLDQGHLHDVRPARLSSFWQSGNFSAIPFGEDNSMMLIREIMYCKPGKVRPMVEKFLAMSAIQDKAGLGKIRVMTDYAGERYWTIVGEFEVKNMQEFEDMMAGKGMTEEMTKQFEEIMKGYHDLIDYGRREIYKIEGS